MKLPHKIQLLVVLTLLLSATSVQAQSPTASQSACKKAGQTRTTKGVKYICVKSGKKTVWQIQSKSTKEKTTSTTVLAETYIAPTSAGASTDECKLVEASPERAKYGNIFVAFPPLGGNFEATGTFKVVLIPIDWADLPGEANPLSRVTDQIKQFNEWFDTVSEGKVSFVWSTYDKYVRVPGSASSYFQAQSCNCCS